MFQNSGSVLSRLKKRLNIVSGKETKGYETRIKGRLRCSLPEMTGIKIVVGLMLVNLLVVLLTPRGMS